MSSIRPLATITVLALVGVFLYLKINETEPPLPEGVEDWSVGSEIDLDMGLSDSNAIPEFNAAPSNSQAPTFTAAPDSGGAAPAFDGGATAPSWDETPVTNPPQLDVAEAPALGAPAGVVASVPARTEPANVPLVSAPVDTNPAFPDLPPLPDLPPAATTANPVTETTLPSTQPNLTTAQPSLPPLTSPQNTVGNPVTPATTNSAQASLFSATRLAVQAALDRGELSQALLLLSDWYGDPSLSPSETKEVNTLLSQLAGSVIYSTEHRLEPPYMVSAGERLEEIAKKYQVPWQLLAKINGITSADQLQPGQQLKVVRGPFSALIDMSQRKMTLMLDRRYAGQFALNIDPSVSIEEGHWEVNQKLLTPAAASVPGVGPTTPTEERSLMLSNMAGGASQVAILRGAATSNALADPAGRVLRLSQVDVQDVYDILSLGSKVVIRR